MQLPITAQAEGDEDMYAHDPVFYFLDALQKANLSKSVANAFNEPIDIDVHAATWAPQFVVEDAA